MKKVSISPAVKKAVLFLLVLLNLLSAALPVVMNTGAVTGGLVGPLAYTLAFDFLLIYFSEENTAAAELTIPGIIIAVLAPAISFYASSLSSVMLAGAIILAVFSLTVIFNGQKIFLAEFAGFVIFTLLFGKISLSEIILPIAAVLMISIFTSHMKTLPELICSIFIMFLSSVLIIFIQSTFKLTAILDFDNYSLVILGLLFLLLEYFVSDLLSGSEEVTESSPAAEAAAGSISETFTASDNASATESAADIISAADGQGSTESTESTADIPTLEEACAAAARKASEEAYASASAEFEATVKELSLKNAELGEKLQDMTASYSMLKTKFDDACVHMAFRIEDLTASDSPYLQKLQQFSPKLYRHCSQVARISSDAAAMIGCDSETAGAIAYYHEAGRMLGENYATELINRYHVPKNLLRSIEIIRSKSITGPISRELGIVSLTDDILNTMDYISKQNRQDISVERIVNNTFTVRKDQNFLKQAGFSSEEIHLLKIFYTDIGGNYDSAD